MSEWKNGRMRRIVASLGVSLLVHGLLALVLVGYFEYASERRALPALDLSSVELSFAEREAETAAVMPMPAVPPEKNEVRMRKKLPPPPELEKTTAPSPIPQDPKFREPKESPTRFEEKEASRETQDVMTEPAPRQARVDAPPRSKRTIRPDYPRGARLRGEQGDVVLEVDVNEAGTVDDVRVVASSGFAELDAAAVAAVRKARFVPGRSGASAVASSVGLKLSFRLK